jgi:putative transposase
MHPDRRGREVSARIVDCMLAILLSFFRFLRLLGSGHQAVAVENLALRRQLAAYRRKRKRPVLTRLDRLFWIGLSQVWQDWRDALVFVQPDTVVRWQRERFRRFWARLSRPQGGQRGRPALANEVRRLILQMGMANPLWRAPRVHGELKMLGIVVSERTVSRVLRTIPRPPSQNWKTFLKNHLSEIVSTDFFTVPTVQFRILFVFLVLEHRRREVLHFNVTDHPTSAWVAQQMMEAFGDRAAPRYLIRDRDGVYGHEVRERLKSLDIEEVLTAPQSPWQNAYAERLIGSIRRECLNHFVVFNSRHLKRTLAAYFRYYHRSRTHLGLGKQCPIERAVMDCGVIVEKPELGGLHHRYERLAA